MSEKDGEVGEKKEMNLQQGLSGQRGETAWVS